MKNPLGDQKVILTVLGIIILTAIGLAISGYKIPSKKGAVNSQNANSSVNTNSMSTTSLPFAAITEEQVTNKQVRITTAKGDIVFKLDPVAGPLAAKNFVYLVNRGYYDGLTFHRVEKSPVPFVIQGGDPLGNGTGGPGYQFPDDPITGSYLAGTVAMANAGPDTNGSQFFIMLADTPGLGKNYSIFGQVTSGMDIVQQIVVGDVMTKVVVEPIQE